eukprot:TRINITY_DN16587_c0_g1_i1.p1 TRINITY_DN16587_c0_g1~~TRINITY_DN16587_c0_g1_i1.p1  ORF type:complete len:307 (+),score=51.28 TRINITY_DN16587_c0_g1_i1:201-1121(+)
MEQTSDGQVTEHLQGCFKLASELAHMLYNYATLHPPGTTSPPTSPTRTRGATTTVTPTLPTSPRSSFTSAATATLQNDELVSNVFGITRQLEEACTLKAAFHGRFGADFLALIERVRSALLALQETLSGLTRTHSLSRALSSVHTRRTLDKQNSDLQRLVTELLKRLKRTKDIAFLETHRDTVLLASFNFANAASADYHGNQLTHDVDDGHFGNQRASAPVNRRRGVLGSSPSSSVRDLRKLPSAERRDTESRNTGSKRLLTSASTRQLLNETTSRPSGRGLLDTAIASQQQKLFSHAQTNVPKPL